MESIGLNLGTGVQMTGTARMDTQGSMITTGNGLDMAIEGAGFFQNSACDMCDDVMAETADVSPRTFFNYFSGKDELVQELYRQLQVEHRQAAAPGIEPGARLEVNLAHVLHRGLDTNAPYHAFGSTLLARCSTA